MSRGAKYVVVGGFAIRAANFNRTTMDVDLMVAADLENEAKVFAALATLPDNAVSELQPGELQRYNVIRIGDEIVVDLLCSAGGIEYAEAVKDIVVREVDGVPIPFASPRLLWRMKVVTHGKRMLPICCFCAHGLLPGENLRRLKPGARRGIPGRCNRIARRYGR